MSYLLGPNIVIEKHHSNEKLINETLPYYGMLFLGPALFQKSTQSNSVGEEIEELRKSKLIKIHIAFAS